MTRLLIGYDASDAARAAIAAAAALFPGADTVVATVHPPPPTLEAAALARAALPQAMIRDGIERMRADAHERARATAAEGADLAAAAGLTPSPTVLLAISPWRVLRDEARRVRADVLACGTRGAGPVERVLLGSTASSLVHHAECPLLIVPAGDGSLAGPVLAGYDDSDGSRRALHFAADHVRARPLIVGHAWRSPVRHTLRGHALLGSGVDVFEDYAETLDTIWREIAEETAEDGAAYIRELGVPARSTAPESGLGDWQALLHGARDTGAAVILAGSRGRGAVAATVLGSVTSGLVHAAELPVIVVPAG